LFLVTRSREMFWPLGLASSRTLLDMPSAIYYNAVFKHTVKSNAPPSAWSRSAHLTKIGKEVTTNQSSLTFASFMGLGGIHSEWCNELTEKQSIHDPKTGTKCTCPVLNASRADTPFCLKYPPKGFSLRVDTQDKNGVFVLRAFKQGWCTCNFTKSGPSRVYQGRVQFF
jgi:hypothetical protein